MWNMWYCWVIIGQYILWRLFPIMNNKIKGKVGNPEHIATLQTRAKVEGFVCAGFSQGQIANYFQIDEKTLRKHYRDELDKSKMDKTMILGNNLYLDAINGNEQAREFWLKCQGRWSYAKPPEDEKASKTEALLEKLIDKL